VGRGIANDLIQRVAERGPKVLINMVEVLSFRTPNQPLDLQMLFEDKLLDAPPGTQVRGVWCCVWACPWGTHTTLRENTPSFLPATSFELDEIPLTPPLWASDCKQVDVTARTNLSLGILDMVDLTYTMPPLTVGISAALTSEMNAANKTVQLFTVSVPEMDKYAVSGPLIVDTSMSIDNFYHSALFLEQLIADLQVDQRSSVCMCRLRARAWLVPLTLPGRWSVVC
jgi:hypothetical protein